jgi:hypothetical protein
MVRPDSVFPLFSGVLGSLLSAFATALESSGFAGLIGSLGGILGAVLFSLGASLLGLGIVVLLSRSTNVYNKRLSPAPDSVFQAQPVGITTFFTGSAATTVVGSASNSVSSAASQAISVITSNLLLIVILVLLFAFYFVFDSWHHIIIRAYAQFLVNFLLGFVRSIIIPIAAIAAFLFDNFTVLLNGVRHTVQSGTVVTIEKSLICGFGTLQIVGLSAAQLLNQTIIDTELYLRVNGTSTALTRGPDYSGTAAQLGLTIAQTKGLFDCACQPLSDRLFAPLTVPFTQPAFVNAINATLGILPALVTQVIFRPIAVAAERANGAPIDGTDARADIVPPSFNATFDLISFAVTNATVFLDSFAPSLQNSTQIFLSELLGIELPDVILPRAGVLTVVIGTPVDILAQTAKDVANLIVNAIFNSESVFAADGFLFWRLDDAFEALKRGTLVAEGYLQFAADYLRGIGSILASSVRKRSDVVLIKALAHLPQSTLGNILQTGFNLVAQFVDTTRCFLDSIVIQFGIQFGQLVVDLPIGTLYRTIDAIINTGVPDVLAFAKELWGDDTVQILTCNGAIDFDNAPDNTGNELFRANIAGCLDAQRFVRFCQDAAVNGFNGTLPAGFTLANPPNDLFETGCPAPGPHNLTASCTTFACLVVPGNNACHGISESLSPNVFANVLEGLLSVFQCITEFFDNLCDECGFFGVFLGRPLAQVIVDVLLIPLNIVIHIDLVVTTEYLGTCVDFQTPLNDIEALLDDFAAAFSTFNKQFTGTACPIQSIDSIAIVSTNGATFLCAFGGAVQFGGITVIEFVRQLTIAFQTIIIGITAAAGVVEVEAFENILDQLDFDKTLSSAQVFILNVVALVLSIFIPASFICADDPTTNVRTEFVNALGTLGADIVLLIPRAVLNGLTTIIQDLTKDEMGGVISTVVNVVGDLFTAVLGPILQLIGDAFHSFANVLNCLTAANAISDVFSAIGDFFLSDTLAQALQLVVEIIIDFIAFVVGIIQVIVTLGKDTDLLEDSVALFVQLIGDLIILIFGADTACSIQSAVCAIISQDAQLIVEQCAAAGSPATSCDSALQSTTLQCVADVANCANPFSLLFGVACPSSPFGCCSSLPGFPAAGSFPTINNAATVSCQTGEFCDERSTCSFNLPVDANGVATIPFTPIASSTDPASALGQSDRDIVQQCPLFHNLTDCTNPGLIDVNGNPLSHGDVARAQPFGLHFAANAKHTDKTKLQPLLNTDYCMGVINTYGADNAAALFAPLKHLNNEMHERGVRKLIQQINGNTAMIDLTRCYVGLYPEAFTTMHTHRMLLNRYTNLLGQRTTPKPPGQTQATGIAAHLISSLTAVAHRGRVIYEANRRASGSRRVNSRNRISPTERHAAFSAKKMRLGRSFRVGRTTMARSLASMRLSHDADQRVSDRKLTHSFFESWEQWQKQRRYTADRRRSAPSERLDLPAHGAALLMHISDAVEHVGYALHYHLNLRPAHLNAFGMPKARRVEEYQSHRLSRPKRAIAAIDDMPHPLHAVQLWMAEKKQLVVDRMLDKFRGFLNSEGHVPATPEEKSIRWPKVIYHREAVNHVDGAITPMRYRTYAIVENDTSLSEILGVDQCDTGEQIFCTGCALVDNIVFGVEQQVNATIDFYGADGGFQPILQQFETTIHNTLVDPVGPDTYTTRNPRTPFILHRFLNIDWPWKWDYSELRAIIYGPNDATDTSEEMSASGFSLREQEQQATAANRTDANLQIYSQTSMFVAPIIDFLDQLVFRITQIGPVDTIIRLFERYIVCDYTKGLFGQEPHSTGLFDALVITIVGLFVIAVFLSAIPGANMCFMMLYGMIGMLIFLPLVFWIGYGASPLCTLPSFFGGIPGVPTPFATDLERLLEETFPECPPVNPAMIDPAFFAQASVTLCGQASTVPPLIPCSQAAGFFDGFDNIFFMLTGLYGEGVTFQVADELEPFAPEVAQVARIYTDAHNDALADNFEIGALCNFITIGNTLTVLIELAIIALLAVGLFALVVFLIGLLLIAIVLGIYANFVIWLQVRKGFLAQYRQYSTKQKTE